MKKKKTKKKIKFKNILIVLGIIIVIALIILWYTSLNITNIYVTGNKLLKEQDIIEIAKLDNYPKVYQVLKSDIQDKLLKNELINKVKVSKTLFGKITIEVEENEIILKLLSGDYLMSNNKEIHLNDELIGLPFLINDCTDVRDILANKLTLIDKSILKHISEIEYKPNDLDSERFLLYMNDGNYVYITLSKIELLNTYNEIYPTLDGKKGILYLDSGNHFEIKK